MEGEMKAVEETKGEGKRWLEFEKRLLAYSAVATAATIGFSPSAGALIQHTAVPLIMDETGSGGNYATTYDWNIDALGGNEFSFYFSGSSTYSTSGSTTISSYNIKAYNNTTNTSTSSSGAGLVTTTNNTAIKRLGQYFVVGPTMTGSHSFLSNSYTSTVTSSGSVRSGLAGAMPTYIGFRFVDDTGTAMRYGWAQVTVTPRYMQIHQWAWEDTGAQILVGDTINPPTTHASAILFANTAETQTDVSWTAGNGGNRIVVAREGAAVNWTPTNGTAYTANADFSAAADEGNGNKVVYNGAGTNFVLTGLTAGTTYHFAVIEYNGTDATPTCIKYIAGGPAQGNETTSGAGIIIDDDGNLLFGGCFISTIMRP
jgi:hypothetical protein